MWAQIKNPNVAASSFPSPPTPAATEAQLTLPYEKLLPSYFRKFQEFHENIFFHSIIDPPIRTALD